MKLSLEALQVLDAIERRGSFAGAAAELHRVPSALTYQIQKLEQDLQVRLFDRSGRRAALTAIGQELLREGRNLLRAAGELESRVKRLATGWEVELRIAVEISLCVDAVLPLVAEFYTTQAGTRLRLSHEALGGTWDALADGRADLVIGAPGDGPGGGGYSTKTLGTMEWVYAVAPTHPLAEAAEPLDRETLLQHRAVVVADSSRSLATEVAGLYSDQDVMAVPDMAAQLQAQIVGLGGGFLPLHIARPALAAGTLVTKTVAEQKTQPPLRYAWRTGANGRSLKWFLKRLAATDIRRTLLGTSS